MSPSIESPVRPSRIAPDAWLGAALGTPAWRLHPGDEITAGAVRELLHAHVGDGPSFVDAKIPVDASLAVAALCGAGFELVDTNVVLDLAAAPAAAPPTGGVTLRDAHADDVAAVGAVARTSFTFTRFHADPAIADAVADELKGRWAESFFSGGRGDLMAVAADAAGPCGFLLALAPAPGEAVIDLIAVAARARRTGVGAALVRHVWDAMQPHRMIVGTQLANTPSLRFYEQLGFRIRGASHVLHRHGEASA